MDVSLWVMTAVFGIYTFLRAIEIVATRSYVSAMPRHLSGRWGYFGCALALAEIARAVVHGGALPWIAGGVVGCASVDALIRGRRSN